MQGDYSFSGAKQGPASAIRDNENQTEEIDGER